MTLILYERADHPDMYYITKWDSDVKCLYVESEDTQTLYVPGFEYLRAKKEISTVSVKKLSSIKEVLSQITEDVRVNTSFAYALSKHLAKQPEVISTVHESRKQKTSEEITHIRRAQQISQQAIKVVTDLLDQVELKGGVAHIDGEVLTAEYCKLQARTYLLSQGADCPELIVSSGKQTSQPHNRGSGPIREGPVIIDIFAQTTSKYHGDCTRTYLLGECPTATRMYEAVKEAHDVCAKKAKTNMSVSELNHLAESILERHGFENTKEKGFIHSLGHGVGLAVHEAPSISPASDETLKESNVITIEPGLYYDVGVRYENIILVSDNPEIL